MFTGVLKDIIYSPSARELDAIKVIRSHTQLVRWRPWGELSCFRVTEFFASKIIRRQRVNSNFWVYFTILYK
jgi:hypothetical protein